jgi:hypothetical protein
MKVRDLGHSERDRSIRFSRLWLKDFTEHLPPVTHPRGCFSRWSDRQMLERRDASLSVRPANTCRSISSRRILRLLLQIPAETTKAAIASLTTMPHLPPQHPQMSSPDKRRNPQNRHTAEGVLRRVPLMIAVIILALLFPAELASQSGRESRDWRLQRRNRPVRPERQRPLQTLALPALPAHSCQGSRTRSIRPRIRRHRGFPRGF